MKALHGAQITLKKFKPVLSLEVDEHSYNKINDYLNNYSYKSYILSQEGHLILVNNINKKYSNLIFKTDK